MAIRIWLDEQSSILTQITALVDSEAAALLRVERLTETMQTLEQQLTEARAEAEQLQQQVADTRREVARLTVERDELRAEVLRLTQTIATLTMPPVAPPGPTPMPEPVPVPDPVPVVTVPGAIVEPTRTAVPFCGVYFEDEGAVNSERDAANRANRLLPVLEFVAACRDLTDYVVFANLDEVKLGALPQLIRNHHRRWWLSPAQFILRQRRPQESLQRYVDAGVYGLIIDDANGVPPQQVAALCDLAESFRLPVIASFLAGFDETVAGYPVSRYTRASQWYPGRNERESHWFPRWQAVAPAVIPTLALHQREGGFRETADRMWAAYRLAMEQPGVQGVAWYTAFNAPLKTDIRQLPDHWRVMQECARHYWQAWRTGEMMV
jgi:hypothetical protein